ncbi:MAG: hypothetical protein ACLQVG_17755 [Terriglobia bacterium]
MRFEVPRKALIFIGLVIVTGYGLQARSASPEKKSSGKRLEFSIVAMADWVDEEATKAGFHTALDPDTHLGSTKFGASDGETLFTYDGEFRSPEEAKRYLDWTVARSSKILKQGIEADSKGKSVGYRAEVLREPDQKDSAVMWTKGATFRQIIGRSFADALELAKRYGY